jgi:isopenicillin-N N-acyltransferase-like protein
MTKPILDLYGDPVDRGRVHGEKMSVQIGQNIERYMKRFELLGFGRDAVLSESAKWSEALRSKDTVFWEEIDGVVQGSGHSLDEITLLNVRYELLVNMMKSNAQHQATAMDACTSFAVLPERSKTGETMIGQNWDWVKDIHTMVSRVTREDGPDFIHIGETGTIGGLQGVNENGIGTVINALLTPDDGKYPYEKPYRMRVRDIMNARNMQEAILAVCGTNRSVSMNFLLAHEDGIAIDIETSPDREAFIYPEDGLLTHSNHFCELDIESEVVKLWPNTMYRNVRLERLLRQSQELDSTTIQLAMADHFSHPHSICAHYDDNEAETLRLQSNHSIMISLNQRTLYITDSSPCKSDYEVYPLAA